MIYRFSIATALLMTSIEAIASNEQNSEFYNTLKNKANAYYSPTVHMNDGDDLPTLHAAEDHPHEDPFVKYAIYDPVKQTHLPTGHTAPHKITDDPIHKFTKIEEPKHAPDYAYWSAPSAPRDYSKFQTGIETP